MPGRNGTGPMGAGPMTGRGLGFCLRSADKMRGAGLGAGLGLGLGLAFRRGFGGGFRSGFFTDKTYPAQKDILQERRDFLKKRLELIDEQLNKLQ